MATTYEPATQEEIDIVLAAFSGGDPIPPGFAVNMSWNPRVRRLVSDPPGPAPEWPAPYFSAFDARLDVFEIRQRGNRIRPAGVGPPVPSVDDQDGDLYPTTDGLLYQFSEP